MPKPLTPEQLAGLQNNGVVIPGFTPEAAAGNPDLPAGSVLRALGNIGLPHSEVVGRLDPDTPGPDWTLAPAAFERTKDLLRLVNPGLAMPELSSPELAGLNWSFLQATHQAYERLGILTEMVVGPEGQPLEFWKNFFSGLRQWQDVNAPDSPHRLKNQSDGDGLYINSEVASNWDQLARTEQPRWSASVIPITPKAPVLNIDHKGQSDNAGTTPAGLTNILQALPGNKLIHPSMESYLLLQADRLQTGQQPIDSFIDNRYYWSWLEGEFTVGQSRRAPAGDWIPDDGQVGLHRGDVDRRDGNLGGRPSGRG